MDNPAGLGSAESIPQINSAPRPAEAPKHCDDPHVFGDLTVSSIADTEIQSKVYAASSAVTSLNVGANLRPPPARHLSYAAPQNRHKPPAPSARKLGHPVSSPHNATLLQTKRTPTVRRSGSTSGAGATRTPIFRSGSTVASFSRPQPSVSRLTTSKKPKSTVAATPMASSLMNDSTMSFLPSGEVDADGNALSKAEEERLRNEIVVTYGTAMRLQIMRAKLRKSAESQGRDVVSQLTALWEETMRLRESDFRKKAEAADVRRQRELHLATKLDGAIPISENDIGKPKSYANSGTPVSSFDSSSRRFRPKQSSVKRSAEVKEKQTDLRTVCELLEPTMKDLSLLTSSIDKTRHALPLKDVVNASVKELTSALHFFEGGLVDMPKMAKLASSQAEVAAASESIESFRESASTMGRECNDTADSLQQAGEMMCHVLALNECSRLKARSSDWTK